MRPFGHIYHVHWNLTIKDDKTEENTFEILQHSDININNS